MTFIGFFASGADESGEECASGRRPSRASTALAVVVGAPLQEAVETPLQGASVTFRGLFASSTCKGARRASGGLRRASVRPSCVGRVRSSSAPPPSAVLKQVRPVRRKGSLTRATLGGGSRGMAAFMKVSSRLLTVVRPARSAGLRRGDRPERACAWRRPGHRLGVAETIPTFQSGESLLRRVHHPREQRQPAALHIAHASYDVVVEITSPALGRGLLIGFETMELAQSSQSRRLARSTL